MEDTIYMELYMSDLHLGSPLFKSKYEILNLLNRDFEKVVIVGDLFDTWEDSFDAIIDKNKEIVSKIQQLSNLVIIKGNHDPDIDRLKEVFPNAEVCKNHDFGRVVFIHGHEFDSIVTKYSWVAKILFPIHWVLERFNLNLKGYLVRLFHSIAAKKNKKYYNSLVLNIEQEAIKKYRDKFNTIIMGHTHLPKHFTTEGIRYINLGNLLHHKTYCIYNNNEYTLHILN